MPDEVDRASETYAVILEAGIARQRRNARPCHPRPAGEGLGVRECVDCGDRIPDARKKAVPGCQKCIGCQNAFERRGSKGRGKQRPYSAR